MGKLFDKDNFSFKDALLDPLVKPIEGTVSIVKNVADGDFKGILGDNQRISTEALKNLGFNPDNKLVKNSDAIAGTIIGGIFAAPAIAGAMGMGSAGAGAAGAAGSAGAAGGASAGGALSGGASAASSAGGSGFFGSGSGLFSGSSGGMFSPKRLIGQGIKQGMKGMQKQQQAASMPQPMAMPQAPSGGGKLGTGLTYDKLMEMF